MPPEGSEESRILQEAQKLRERWAAEGTHGFQTDAMSVTEEKLSRDAKNGELRFRRQTLPATDYVVEIFVMVDYKLYDL